MAVIGWEGFDAISASPQADLPYKPFGTGNPTGVPAAGFWWGYFSGFGTLSKQAGLFGGGALGGNTTSGAGGLVLNSNYTTAVIGYRIKAPGLPYPVNYPIMSLLDGGATAVQGNGVGTTQCGLCLNSAGNVLFFRGGTASAPGTILATSPTQLISQSWYMLELKFTIDNAAGTAELRLGGSATPEFTLAGIDTQTTANAFMNGLQLFPNGNGFGAAFYDDFYMDTNTFLGNVRVETYFPTANTAVAWIPSAGTNWQEVSEANMDSNTTYNSTTVPATDTFGHGSTAITPITIFGVNVCSCARKSDVKALTYRNKLTSGATSVNGVTAALATGFTYTNDQYLVDPNTGLAWTTAAMNATICGYERVT